MKRGGFLKRKTPLRRGPWRRKGKARHVSSYRRRERHVAFMLWVKTQPCIVTTMGVLVVSTMFLTTGYVRTGALSEWAHAPCWGDIQADHAGTRAMGRKAHDNTCIPFCQNHHDQKTNGWGLFANLTLEQKRQWRIDAIAFTQARAREQGVEVPVDAGE